MVQIQNINADTLQCWLDQSDAILIDVREPDEYRYEHIEQAVNMPLSSLTGQRFSCPEDKKIVLQCRSGNRSLQAGQIIGANGNAAPLYNLAGGIEGWKKAGFKVAAEKNAMLPLQQQVQVAVGALVLMTVALGYFVNPAFLIITAFVGGGLLNAGLTGWCGLAKVLAVMPWNKQ
ncbi:MAG: rhodanese-like domain-containing protein [Micavibrio sp.]